MHASKCFHLIESPCFFDITIYYPWYEYLYIKKLDPKLVPERAQHSGGKMWHEMNQPYFSTPKYKVLFQYYDILPHYYSVLQSTTPWSKYVKQVKTSK